MSTEQLVFTLPAQLKYLTVVGAALMTMLEEKTESAYNIQLAIHEAAANIIEHGYRQNPDGHITVILMVDDAAHCFTADISDNAPPFHPQRLAWDNVNTYWQVKENGQSTLYTLHGTPEPDPLQDRGRGFFLMAQLMDTVTCTVSDRGNQWQLKKKW